MVRDESSQTNRKLEKGHPMKEEEEEDARKWAGNPNMQKGGKEGKRATMGVNTRQ